MQRENPGDEWEASDVSVALTMDGNLLARTGTIGSDSDAWSIGAHAIFNGPESMDDTETDGMYVGTDGLMTVATGALGYHVFTKIYGGQIYSTSTIRASRIVANTASLGGATGDYAVQTYGGYIGLHFQDGVLVSVT